MLLLYFHFGQSNKIKYSNNTRDSLYGLKKKMSAFLLIVAIKKPNLRNLNSTIVDFVALKNAIHLLDKVTGNVKQPIF